MCENRGQQQHSSRTDGGTNEQGNHTAVHDEGQTANLAAEVGHDQRPHPAGAAAEPVPDLEFDQTLGL